MVPREARSRHQDQQLEEVDLDWWQRTGPGRRRRNAVGKEGPVQRPEAPQGDRSVHPVQGLDHEGLLSPGLTPGSAFDSHQFGGPMAAVRPSSAWHMSSPRRAAVGRYACRPAREQALPKRAPSAGGLPWTRSLERIRPSRGQGACIAGPNACQRKTAAPSPQPSSGAGSACVIPTHSR